MYRLDVIFKNKTRKHWYYRKMENAFHKYLIISQCPSVSKTYLTRIRGLCEWPPRSCLTMDELRTKCLRDAGRVLD